jgi:TATA-binding protein-associated factor Taf7
LTVADDLLKNDGQKFLEMMEQLAERRMAREDEAERAVGDESDEESESDDDDEEGSEEEEDEEGESEGSDEEVSPFFFFFYTKAHTRRSLPKNKKCSKANACSQSLLHECSNNVSSPHTAKK